MLTSSRFRAELAFKGSKSRPKAAFNLNLVNQTTINVGSVCADTPFRSPAGKQSLTYVRRAGGDVPVDVEIGGQALLTLSL